MTGQGGRWLRALVVGASYGAISFLCLSVSRLGAPVNRSGSRMLCSLPRYSRRLAEAGRQSSCAARWAMWPHIWRRGIRSTSRLPFWLATCLGGLICAVLLGADTLAIATRRNVFRFLIVCGLIGPFVSH